MSKKLKAAEDRIAELLGDSIENHRQESEFLEYVGDEVDKLLAENAALKSQSAGVREWRDIAVTDWNRMQGASWLDVFGGLDDILFNPSHTCAGCEDYKQQIERLNETIEALEQPCDQCGGRGSYLIDGEPQECICIDSCPGCAAKDKRLGDAREAFRGFDEIDGPPEVCHHCTSDECAQNLREKFYSQLDAALNGGDGFLKGNPHHLGTDTALNGKEGEDG